MAEVLTPDCPLCGEPPMMVLGGGTQAFCATDGCRMFTWNPALSRSANLQAADFIDLSPLGGDGDDS